MNVRPAVIPDQDFTVRDRDGQPFAYVARPTASEALQVAVALYGEDVYLTRTRKQRTRRVVRS